MGSNYESFCILRAIIWLVSQDDISIPCSHLLVSSFLFSTTCLIILSIPINY